ncbi:MAG: biotin synthase BioB [Chlamydiota bacterium]
MNKTVLRALSRIRVGERISRVTALSLVRAPLGDLLRGADALRRECGGNRVALCAITNARSGLCGEDCAFCAQSSRHAAGAPVYPMRGVAALLSAARNARAMGAVRFGVVTSGRAAGRGDVARVCAAVRAIRRMGGIIPCASLGEIGEAGAGRLKRAGLSRYHHNLETSPRFFPSACTTHRWADRVRTVRAARRAGLQVCSGGLFGLGETWGDRVDLALALRELGVDSVPLNFLMPVRGTPLGKKRPLPAREALRIIAVFRFVLPLAEIRVAGGRELVLGKMQERIFAAGANAMMVGDYLTAKGRAPGDDLRMLRRLGLEVGCAR